MCEVSADNERGRGLRIVEALSVHWGWHPEDGGKAIFAVLAKEEYHQALDHAIVRASL
jgi:hypothetical protein